MVMHGGKLTVAARNKGERRLRISELKLRGAGGKTASFGNGLVGYSLGRSTMYWAAPGSTRDLVSGGSVQITAQSDIGPIHAVAPLQKAP